MNQARQSCNGSLEDRVAEVVDAFMAEVHAGGRPDVEEYARRHPELAGVLRQVLPALEVMGPGDSGEEVRDGGLPGRGCLGDFRLLREVGRGGMGVVYEAEQLSLGRRVALKVLPFAATMDPRHLQRFHNEARAAACLRHEHIVPVHAVGCERGVHFYAMQFVEGQSLAELIARLRRPAEPSGPAGAGQPTTAYAPADGAARTAPAAALTTEPGPRDAAYHRRVAEWGVQAAKALEHAHSLGIVHRDVKPGNLMVDAQGRLCVTDFGLARSAADTGLTMTGDVLGTLRYMSPEQALARHNLVDHRTDVYGLGATLYELLTLQPAVGGRDRQEILQQIAACEAVPPRKRNPAVPVDLETVVLKAMAREPQERYATAQELADDLRRFLGHEPVRARRAGPWARARKWVRRRPALAALFGVTAFSAAALVSGLLWHNVQLREAAAREQRQSGRATRQRDAAWRAVNDMYTQVAEKWLSGEPGMSDVQREFLEKALHYYEDLAREEGEGPGQLLERAKANRRCGAILDKLERRAEAEAAYRRGISLLEGADIPGKAVELAEAYSLLGNFLAAAVRNAEAEAAFHRALTLWESVPADEAARPEVRFGRAQTLSRLGGHLAITGRAAESEPFFRQGLPLMRGLVAEFPREARYHSLLGAMLNNYSLARSFQNDPVRAYESMTEAIAHQGEAVKLAPRDPRNRLALRNHYATLAVSPLLALKRYPDALAAARKSLAVSERLARDFPDVPHYRRCLADAYGDLGEVLRRSGQLPKAEEAYTEAVKIQERVLAADPNSPRDRKQACSLYAELGELRRAAGRGREAVGAYRRAIQLGSGSAEVHRNLGIALAEQGEAVEAEAAFRRAIKLRPKFPGAHNSLAIALGAQGKWADAEEACRRAIALNPDFPEAHNSLGVALREQGKLPKAVAAFHQAIKLKPNYAGAYFNLGDTLRRQGRFKESLAAIREGHRLGTKQPGWSHPSAEWVREAEEIITLDEKLPAVLEGRARPADPREMLLLAQVARFRGLCAASAKLYSDAFALDPKMAQTPEDHLYDAARAAALAGVGRSVDAPSTPEELRGNLRRQTLRWLRADLKARSRSLDIDSNKTRTEIAKQMRRWQQDEDFAGVRGPDALAKLSEAERRQWQTFWKEVEALRRRAAGPREPRKEESPQKK